MPGINCQCCTNSSLCSFFLWIYPLKSSGILNHSRVTLWICCHGEFPGSFTRPLPCPRSVTMETFFLSRISLIRTVARDTVSGIPISCPLQQTCLFLSANIFCLSWALSSSQMFYCISLGVWNCVCIIGQKKQFAWGCCLLSCHDWWWNVNRSRHSFVLQFNGPICRNKKNLGFFIIL